MGGMVERFGVIVIYRFFGIFIYIFMDWLMNFWSIDVFEF